MSDEGGRQRRWTLLALLALLATTWLTFQPLLGAGFVWDDRDNLLLNLHFRQLDFAALSWIFGEGGMRLGHYQPLTWLSYALDHALWGMRPAGYHLTNLLLHLAVMLLLARVLRRFVAIWRDKEPRALEPSDEWACVLAAAFYALHPLRVENVAWLTERRDLLAALFYLLGALLYLRAVRGGSRWRCIAGSWTAFLLSGLAKAWVLSLPLLLLLCDHWLGRLREPAERRRALLEKLAFVPLAIAFGWLAHLAVNAVGAPAQGHGAWPRMLQASYGLFYYPLKTLAPWGLSPLHLLRSADLHDLWHHAALASAVALGGTLLVMARRRPGLFAAGWGYAIFIAPVLGLAQVGQQAMADRYAYLATWPLWVLLAVLLAAGLRRLSRAPMVGRALAAVCALALLLGCALSSHRYTAAWIDEASLWRHAVTQDPDNAVAWTNLADVQRIRGERAAATKSVRRALALAPRHAAAWGLLGGLEASAGRFAEAEKAFRRALALSPKSALLRCQRGTLALLQRRLQGASADFRVGISLDPRQPACYLGRSRLRQLRGDVTAALVDADTYVRLAPLDAGGWLHRGQLRLARGAEAEALRDLQRAVKQRPRDRRGREILASVYARRGLRRARGGELRGALVDFRAALVSAPKAWKRRHQVEAMARKAARELSTSGR